jgi:DNA-binding NtrC family response regulator
MVQSLWIQPGQTSLIGGLAFAPIVLIVDSERAIRDLCRSVLVRDHLRVLTAADGQEALTLAETWMPDVLVTGISLPGLDGLGLIGAVRRRYPDMPAVVMWGDEEYDGRLVERIVAEHGAIQTLVKPFEVALLCDVVTRQCRFPVQLASTPRLSGIRAVLSQNPGRRGPTRSRVIRHPDQDG